MIVVQYLRSIVFIVQMYIMLAVISVGLFPVALIGRRDGAIWVCRAYCKWVCHSARWIVGLRTEIRGEVPSGDVLVASKHQSFLDILMIYAAVPRGKFIMKKELVWTPFVGWYAYLIGCIPVDRGKRGAAVRSMLARAKDSRMAGGQLIIFPQGTRVAPGVKRDYKIGAGALYKQMQQPCVPAATNVGVFWPRHGILRKPGIAVIEFLPVIPPGLKVSEFMGRLEAEIEPASDALMAEAGFVAR
ncbi:1-acyl-sn-glycerol-3-phosphate acyltransferase [Sinirhodobacter sp. WL0062]|uniref:1-acyl-sn-glycerol-3-phosphate acyltransferase n=1 Tax=Rhodobacter flavimaris TaxID=2907145 RepID=A0ABS8Z0V3_9RHOB|nr:lysophospholipid acyltransferase family protein [Sinirhodobacter sp. WL0062]MCE5973580.1 1-acyl-sn-glycerol-3-phosphate acyltransferase [Sinirhodobacter sp. WL0062]